MVATDRIRAFFSVTNCYAPAVSPNGETIAYRVVEGEGTAVHLLTLNTGEISCLIDNLPPINRDPLYWVPEDERLVSVSGQQGAHNIELVTRTGERERLTNHENRIRLFATEPDTVWYWAEEERGYTLYRHPLDENRIEIATVNPFNHGGGGIHGNQIVVNRVADSTIAPHILDRDGTTEHRLPSATAGWVAHPRPWITDTQLLLTRWRNSGIGVYDLNAEAFVWRDQTIDRPVTDLPNGEFLAVQNYTPVVGGPDDWRTLPLDGAAVIGPLAADELLISDSQAVVPRKSSTRLRELVALDLESGKTELLVEADYGPIDSGDIIAPKAVTYPSYSGGDVDAYLWTPNRSGPFPTVVTMYPPKPDPTPGLKIRIQLLLDAGYAVLWAGHQGDQLETHRDYAAAGEWIADQSGIDGDRVAFYGRSAGGEAALIQAFRHPEVWTAVINWVGRFDLIWAVESDHLDSVRMNEAFPSYEDNPDAWHHANPATYADNLSIPLLAVYGRSDETVPITHGRKLLKAVSDDAPLDYSEFNVGHGVTLDGKVSSWNVILEFLERHLRAT